MDGRILRVRKFCRYIVGYGVLITNSLLFIAEIDRFSPLSPFPT